MLIAVEHRPVIPARQLCRSLHVSAEDGWGGCKCHTTTVVYQNKSLIAPADLHCAYHSMVNTFEHPLVRSCSILHAPYVLLGYTPSKSSKLLY